MIFLMMKKNQPGFTLLELLAAFAIAAIALISLFGMTLTGLAATGLAERHTQALAIARSRLAILDPPNAAVPGTREGQETGGYHWKLTVVPLGAAAAGGADTRRPLILYDVRVSVRWDGGRGRDRGVTLATRRAVTAP